MERNQSPKEIPWQIDSQNLNKRSCQLDDYLEWVKENRELWYSHGNSGPETFEGQTRAIIYLLQEQAEEGWLLVDNGQEKTALSFLHLDNFPSGFAVDIKDAKQIAHKFLFETP